MRKTLRETKMIKKVKHGKDRNADHPLYVFKAQFIFKNTAD